MDGTRAALAKSMPMTSRVRDALDAIAVVVPSLYPEDASIPEAFFGGAVVDKSLLLFGGCLQQLVPGAVQKRRGPGGGPQGRLQERIRQCRAGECVANSCLNRRSYRSR